MFSKRKVKAMYLLAFTIILLNVLKLSLKVNAKLSSFSKSNKYRHMNNYNLHGILKKSSVTKHESSMRLYFNNYDDLLQQAKKIRGEVESLQNQFPEQNKLNVSGSDFISTSPFKTLLSKENNNSIILDNKNETSPNQTSSVLMDRTVATVNKKELLSKLSGDKLATSVAPLIDKVNNTNRLSNEDDIRQKLQLLSKYFPDSLMLSEIPWFYRFPMRMFVSTTIPLFENSGGELKNILSVALIVELSEFVKKVDSEKDSNQDKWNDVFQNFPLNADNVDGFLLLLVNRANKIMQEVVVQADPDFKNYEIRLNGSTATLVYVQDASTTYPSAVQFKPSKVDVLSQLYFLRESLVELSNQINEGTQSSPEKIKLMNRIFEQLQAACDLVERMDKEENSNNSTAQYTSTGSSNNKFTMNSESTLNEGTLTILDAQDMKNFTSFFDNISNWTQALVEEDSISVNSAAENLIISYFDSASCSQGAIISRQGAAQFQNEILQQYFAVTEVKMFQGSAIFQGNILLKSSEEFAKCLEEKFKSSKLSSEVDYFILMNEKYPNLDQGLPQIAMDQLLGKSPAVIMYPKSWNSSVASLSVGSFRDSWKSLVSSAAYLTTGIYAATCYQFDGSRATFDLSKIDINSIISPNILTIGFMSILFQQLIFFVEKAIAQSKGINIRGTFIPTLSIFNYGIRSTVLNPPRDRNEVFDLAASTIGSGLLLSTIAIYAGLFLTTSATTETLNTFPVIPVSLIQTNGILSEIVKRAFDNSQEMFTQFPSSSFIHLHWLSIVGIATFLSTSLQLLPFDNSHGNRLNFAVFGNENNLLIKLFFGLLKGGFLLSAVFFPGSNSMESYIFTKSKLLVDYLLSSQLTISYADFLITKDSLSDITEGRKIIYLGFLAFLTASFIPFLDINLFSLLQDSSNFIQNLIQDK